MMRDGKWEPPFGHESLLKELPVTTHLPGELPIIR